MNSVPLLLADDHTLVRAGLRMLLEELPGIQVVSEAGDGREALCLTRSLQPRIVVMDIGMPKLNGLDATALIKRDFPEIKVLILSMHTQQEHVFQALQAGASSYLVKDTAPQELEQAIQAVLRGELWFSPRISKQVVEGYRNWLKAGQLAATCPLTLRQREILQLLTEGYNTKKIAFELGISVKTVETHRAQLMDRLGIHDIAGLVRYAIRTGLINSDP